MLLSVASTSITVIAILLLIVTDPSSASIERHLAWLPRHASFTKTFKDMRLIRRQGTSTSIDADDSFTPTSNVASIDFTDPTNGDFTTPLSTDLISAVQAIADTSLNNVETGVVVDETGSTQTNAPSTNTPGDGSYQVVDSTSNFILEAAADGNLRVADATAAGNGLVFPMVSGTITQDDQDRTLFYYPSSMSTLGISRIRLGLETQLPVGSQIISLSSIDTGDGTGHGTYMAFDTSNNGYYLITCTYSDQSQSAKVFLAKDARNGIDKLKDESLETTVTGGPIQDCALMPFVSPGFAGISA